MCKRVFIIVADSLGIGGAPDASMFGDEGSDTLGALMRTGLLNTPVLERLGLYNIAGNGVPSPQASYAALLEASNGKDTTIGHWELAGCITKQPFPTYPNGFGTDLLDALEQKTGRGYLCNKPYSGTKVIDDYAKEHIETGKLIVYTSADSVFQVAAHEDVVPLEELYAYCRAAREELECARIIARPFVGEAGNYRRTANRHDFSLPPHSNTLLDVMLREGYDVLGVGKISDIFAGRGLTRSYPTHSNENGMEVLLDLMDKDFMGLCFVNLVDFDMLYGHRNDPQGYAKALNAFDEQLRTVLKLMCREDILIITADHGCDPSTTSTDHSRERVPMLMYGECVKQGMNLGERKSFADIAATIANYFEIKHDLDGESFWNQVKI